MDVGKLTTAATAIGKLDELTDYISELRDVFEAFQTFPDSSKMIRDKENESRPKVRSIINEIESSITQLSS